MAFYYSNNAQGLTTNGTTLTESDHMQHKTGSTRGANIVEVYASARFGTAGGASLRLRRYSTPSSSGSALTPSPRDPLAPAAATTVVTGPTPGTTATQLISIGFPQTGGMGGWVALEPNGGFYMDPAGGANGNIDVFSVAVGVTVPFDLTTGHVE